MSKIIMTITLCISIVLTGCQASGGASSRGVDPTLTKSNSARFFSKSAWQSCAIGAGVGGLGCLLLGGKTATCLASAAVGCGVMMGANYYLDTKRAEYADAEMRLDVYIQDIQQNTYEVQAVTETARAVLDKNLATLNTLNKQIASQSVNKTQARNDLNQIDANIAYLKDKLSNMKKVERDWVSISTKERQSGLNVSKLDKQINQLHKQIAMLEKQVNFVSQQRSAVKVS
jgi:septal ring factor EnvC (AmiA/AmiB activator)